MGKKLKQPENKHGKMKRYNPPDVAGNGVSQGSGKTFPAWLDESKTSGRYKQPKG